jgi:hypothetical protein
MIKNIKISLERGIKEGDNPVNDITLESIYLYVLESGCLGMQS